METTAGPVLEARSTRILYWCAVVFSFAVLAWLNGRAIDARAGFVAVYTLCLLAFALLALAGMGGLLYAFNKPMRESRGFSAAMDSVARGFMALLPFMLLALLAELFLDWNAAQVFTQSGIMICGSVVGVEAMKTGGGKAARIIPPVAGAFAFSFLWMLLSAAAQAAG